MAEQLAQQVVAEFAVTVRLHNNLLRERRERLGVSARELAGRIGVSYQGYLRLENLHAKPFDVRTGAWKQSANRIAAFYEQLPEDLFPPSICGVHKPVATLKLTEAAIGRALSGGLSSFAKLATDTAQGFDQQELSLQVRDALGTLTPREREVMQLRFGLFGEEEHTCAEVGRRLHLGGTRIAQIERLALRKLRKPSRARLLRTFQEDDYIEAPLHGPGLHAPPFSPIEEEARELLARRVRRHLERRARFVAKQGEPWAHMLAGVYSADRRCWRALMDAASASHYIKGRQTRCGISVNAAELIGLTGLGSPSGSRCESCRESAPHPVARAAEKLFGLARAAAAKNREELKRWDATYPLPTRPDVRG